ncbi:MAG: HPr kinase/phosphorylase [Clostridia bacterium]|nr:HPr kinase/phosphorylase [Clostridia bacterium]
MINAQEFAKALKLTVLSPSTREEWDIRSPDLNRPGMQFCGFYEFFAYERPQVIGKQEMAYLDEMDPDTRSARLDTYFSYQIPCVVCCRGMNPPEELLSAARRHDVAVYRSEEVTTTFSLEAITYLSRCLAPRVTMHGVLVDVYNTGVLITGNSGVGKSETALELVKRGHMLVADDVVDICRVSKDRLIGECPEMIRHFMEIRGIGIIDIRAMFGVGAVAQSKSIDLVMHLENWVEGKEYDRLGLTEESMTILGVKVPKQRTPVRPGRNLAIIVEVAARNYSLKQLGYSAAHELDRRLVEIQRQAQQDARKQNADR